MLSTNESVGSSGGVLPGWRRRVVAWLAMAGCLVSLPVAAESTPPAGAKATTTATPSPAPPAGTTAPAAAAPPVAEAPSSDETAPPTADEATAQEVSATAPGIDGATYRVRLRDLEQKVAELKEQVRRSHSRLALLSDTILSGTDGGARAEIEFVNDLGGAWRIVEAVFILDGAVQYKRTDQTGSLSDQKTIPIFAGNVPAGPHTLQVMLKLRGHGFGVFSYLQGIEATVRNDHSFTLTDGKVIRLTATAWEQGGPTTPVEQQPSVRFQQSIRGIEEARKEAAASKPAVTRPAAAASSTGGAPASGSTGAPPAAAPAAEPPAAVAPAGAASGSTSAGSPTSK